MSALVEEEHALEHAWAIWEARCPEKKNLSEEEWANLQQQLCEFDTVEGFWRYFHHIPPPSEVFYDGRAKKRVGSPPNERTIEAFSLFKKGVRPAWEDPANKLGGEWFLRKSLRADEVDEYWRNLVLGLVGETIEGDPGDMITGARVVDKSNGRGQAPTFRLELWLRTKDDKLSAQLKECMLSTITGGSPVRGLAEGFQWKLHA